MLNPRMLFVAGYMTYFIPVTGLWKLFQTIKFMRLLIWFNKRWVSNRVLRQERLSRGYKKPFVQAR